MDTIIDTREFPKEMHEQPREESTKGKGFWRAFFLWFLFILVVALVALFLFRAKDGEQSLDERTRVENEAIERLLDEKVQPVTENTHERMIQNFFQA